MGLRKKKKRKIFFAGLGLILLIIVFLNTFLLLKYNILPAKYLILYGLFGVIIPILLVFYTLFRKKKNKKKLICAFFEIIYIIVMCAAFFYLNKTFDFLNKFTSLIDYEAKNYYVVALNNGMIKDVKDLSNKLVGYSSKADNTSNKALDKLNKTVKIQPLDVEGNGALFEKLDNNEISAILITSSYFDMIQENQEVDEENPNEEKIEKYVVVYKFSIREKSKEVKAKEVDVTKKPFNIYISGIDTYGSVADKTRSDVNILMSINPKTKKILMINIPRDYYVELAGVNQKDKLTHAGTYGIDMSVKTIERLFDIEINYYLKVNYNALIKLVDALGGVDVESEYDFSSYELHHRFKKGINHVNGKQALDFVRTRKAFQYGDRVRGENQQRMIKAIIQKASSAAILVRYDDLLRALDGNFTTNMSTNNITSLINMQLKDMATWNIESISVNGSDGRAYTYSAPSQELYVMIPNEETVNEAKTKLAEIKQ